MIQNILLRRTYYPSARGNREVEIEGNVVDLSLMGVEVSAQRVCKYFRTLDAEGEWLSEIVLCALLAQAQTYAARRWIPPTPAVSPIVELVAYQWYFNQRGVPGFKNKSAETWGQLNGKAKAALSGGDIGELLDSVQDFVNEWGLMYRLDRGAFGIKEMKTTAGVEFVTGSGHAVEVMRKRPDSSSPVIIDEGVPRVAVGNGVTDLPTALQSAWNLAHYRIDRKLQRAKAPLDIVAVDITSRMAGMELLAISALSYSRHLELKQQMAQAVHLADQGRLAILFYARSPARASAAMALPYHSNLKWYGALGTPSIRVRPLRRSDLDPFGP